MNKQFFYTRKIQIPRKEGETDGKVVNYTDSFNLDKVIRSMEMEDKTRLILLDDIHERVQDAPIMSNKGRITGYKKERGTFQSEIYLTKEDSDRFMSVTQ
jgi:hypothetical protein